MDIRYMWVVMATLSVVLFMFQTSADAVSPSASTIFNYNGSIIQIYDDGEYSQEIDPNNGMPVLPAEISSSGGDSGFTDIFQSIKSWFQDSKGGKVVGGLYYAVPNILNGIGLPSPFSYALGIFWTLLAIFSFIMFMRGMS